MGVFIENIARGTSPAGAMHRVLVFTRESEFRVERWDCGAEIYFCPMWFHFASMPIGPAYVKHFKQLLGWADLLHFHYPFPIQDLLYLAGKCLRKMPPALVTYHSDVVRQKLFGKIYAPVARLFLRSVDRVVASSPKYLASSSMLNHLASVDIIPYGISANDFPAVSQNRRSYYQNLFGKGFFLFLGALRYYKGLPWLVSAAAKTGLPVVIAGAGELSADLKKQAAGFRNIHFVGEVTEEDKIALLSLAKAFVFPSHLRSEAFGISLLEALMMRLPLITCEIGTGTSYVNEAGVTGLVVPPADDEALAQAMLKLNSDAELCERFAQTAYKRFLEVFTAEKMSNRYLELYQQMRGR